MKTLARKLLCMAMASLWVAHSVLAAPDPKAPVMRCQKVFSEVGLIVRAKPSSTGQKIGSLAKGEKVKLDGETLPAMVQAVYPIYHKDEGGATWVKIKSPKEGYVLYAPADDDNYTYLVDCGE